MLKNLRNMEFSKKLLYFIMVIILFICALTAVSVFMGMTEPITALIVGIFSLATIAFGFYYWKAKNENIRKYAKNLTWDEVQKLGSLYNELLGDQDGKDI